MRRLDVARDFRRVDDLCRDLQVYIVCKGRRLDPRAKVLSEDRMRRLTPLRAVYSGGWVASLNLGANIADPTTHRWHLEAPEPRGIDVRGGQLLVSTVDALLLADLGRQERIRTIRHPALRALHSACFFPRDGTRALVASSGVDALLDVPLSGEDPVKVLWSAPEAGYGRSRGGIRLVGADAPRPSASPRLIDRREAVQGLQDGTLRPGQESWALHQRWDPIDHPLGLEYVFRGALPNWAGFGASPGELYATLYLTGEAVVVGASGRTRVLASGLRKPHGVLRYRDDLLISDSQAGRVIFVTPRGERRAEVSFAGLPVPHSPLLPSYEWLQFTHPAAEDRVLLSFDGRRAAIYAWSLDDRVYSVYPVDPSLMIQCVVPATSSEGGASDGRG